MTLKSTLTAAVLLAAGAGLFVARCASPSLDSVLTFPFNRQVQICSIKGAQ